MHQDAVGDSPALNLTRAKGCSIVGKTEMRSTSDICGLTHSTLLVATLAYQQSRNACGDIVVYVAFAFPQEKTPFVCSFAF